MIQLKCDLEVCKIGIIIEVKEFTQKAKIRVIFYYGEQFGLVSKAYLLEKFNKNYLLKDLTDVLWKMTKRCW